jgi:hypothetical protein
MQIFQSCIPIVVVRKADMGVLLEYLVSSDVFYNA